MTTIITLRAVKRGQNTSDVRFGLDEVTMVEAGSFLGLLIWAHNIAFISLYTYL